MTTYEAHELALVFPPMSEPEFAAFKEDIREHGQHEPILLYEGKILVSGNATEIANNPLAREVYLGERFSL